MITLINGGDTVCKGYFYVLIKFIQYQFQEEKGDEFFKRIVEETLLSVGCE